MELLPEVSEWAFSDMIRSQFEELLGAAIQLTTFNCGGVAVAIRIVHCLADAQTMGQFVNDWARVNRAILAHTPIPLLAPVFDPSLLDRAAAGDIDADEPDLYLIEAACTLSITPRSSTSSNRYPPSMTPSAQIPLESKDLSAPIGHYLLDFSPKEIQYIWEQASSSGNHVTHFEALAAFLWSLMMRNGYLDREEQIATIPCNIRPRLSPALPATFLGSPIIVASVAGTKSMSLHTLANCIRSSLSQFTPSNLSVLLHDKAYEDSSQRLLTAFLKHQKTIVSHERLLKVFLKHQKVIVSHTFTSWLHLGMNKVDFGAGVLPRYIEGFPPSNLDGCVVIMEAGGDGGTSADAGGARWYDEHVNVAMYLNVEVMQGILKDPLLGKSRDVARAQKRNSIPNDGVMAVE